MQTFILLINPILATSKEDRKKVVSNCCRNAQSLIAPSPSLVGSVRVRDFPLDIRALGAREKVADDKDLQRGHDDDHGGLCEREPKDPGLCRNHGREVAVLTGLEVLLHPVDPRELVLEAVQGLVHGVGVGLGARSLLVRFHLRGALLVLDRDLKVDDLFGKGRHVVREAEGVLALLVGGEDVVALALLLELEEDLAVGSGGLDIDIE
jgi:hypothetical protein